MVLSPFCSTALLSVSRAININHPQFSVTMEEPRTEPIEQLARAIAQRGLTTPARIILDIIAPLDFLASQVTLFARPFIPGNRWTRTIDALCDARGWRMLHDLLNRDC